MKFKSLWGCSLSASPTVLGSQAKHGLSLTGRAPHPAQTPTPVLYCLSGLTPPTWLHQQKLSYSKFKEESPEPPVAVGSISVSRWLAVTILPVTLALLSSSSSSVSASLNDRGRSLSLGLLIRTGEGLH